MSFFNERQIEGFLLGKYVCDECGSQMEFENEAEDVLVCPECGNSMDIDRYGFSSDEEYESLYPLIEDEDDSYDEDDFEEETYEDVYGELDD